jgi:hypothetical protein
VSVVASPSATFAGIFPLSASRTACSIWTFAASPSPPASAFSAARFTVLLTLAATRGLLMRPEVPSWSAIFSTFAMASPRAACGSKVFTISRGFPALVGSSTFGALRSSMRSVAVRWKPMRGSSRGR